MIFSGCTTNPMFWKTAKQNDEIGIYWKCTSSEWKWKKVTVDSISKSVFVTPNKSSTPSRLPKLHLKLKIKDELKSEGKTEHATSSKLPVAKRWTQDRIKISELDITSSNSIVEHFRAIKGKRVEIPVNIEETLVHVLSTYKIEGIKEVAKKNMAFNGLKEAKAMEWKC